MDIILIKLQKDVQFVRENLEENKMDYLKFPLKWFGADLENIKKVRFGDSYFGDVYVEDYKKYSFKCGQIGW